MYQKNEYIFSEVLGVCLVTDIVKLSTKKSAPVQYYIMKSVKDGKISYIPVEKHQVKLRELISPLEAQTLQNKDDLSELERQEIDFILAQQK